MIIFVEFVRVDSKVSADFNIKLLNCISDILFQNRSSPFKTLENSVLPKSHIFVVKKFSTIFYLKVHTLMIW